MSDSGLATPVGYASSGMAHVQIAQYGDDKGLVAEFYSEAVHQQFASEGGTQEEGMGLNKTVKDVPGAGRPIYKDEIFVKITRPGAKSNLIKKVPMAYDRKGEPILDRQGLHMPAKGDPSYPSFPERFSLQWNQFINNMEQTRSGTPLEQYPPLTKAQVLELRGIGIHTIEELASIPDSNLQNIAMMDARKFRDSARAYMDAASGNAALTQAMSTIENQRADIEALKAQFAQLAEERLSEKRGPGRPRKEHSDDN
jgi:hypothetical protein